MWNRAAPANGFGDHRAACGAVLVVFVALVGILEADLYPVVGLLAAGSCLHLEAYALLRLRAMVGTENAHKRCAWPRVAVCCLATVCLTWSNGENGLGPHGRSRWHLLAAGDPCSCAISSQPAAGPAIAIKWVP